MNFLRLFLNLVAPFFAVVRRHRPRAAPPDPRILVIRRNRMGDMIYTVPLLHALRGHFPAAYITVACDAPGVPIAQACPAVNEVVLLSSGRNRWLKMLADAWRLQDIDWVIAAKGGFDRRLAVLARLTNAAIRIGYETTNGPSAYFTNALEIPANLNDEHQIDTLLRLLQPLGIVVPADTPLQLGLDLPAASREFAAKIITSPRFEGWPYMLVNLSSTVPLKFREEDFISLIRRIVKATDLIVVLVGAPAEQKEAQEIAMCMNSGRVTAVDTPGPLDLAALLEKAALLLTPEGGAAHLAAAMNTPALVLWSEGPFKKWYSRGERHAFVHAESGETVIPIDRVWEALHPFLGLETHDGTQGEGVPGHS